MNEFYYSPITENFLKQCHKINEENTPQVGSRTLNEFIELVRMSDFNLCVSKDSFPIGYVICHQDNQVTDTYMEKIKHRNYIEIKKRINNFLYIDRIAIRSQYRNKELASNLYSKVIGYAKENSIANLAAEINLLPKINTPSFNFHKKFKFIEIGTIKYSQDYEVSLQKLII